jgi:hypothetical protein
MVHYTGKKTGPKSANGHQKTIFFSSTAAFYTSYTVQKGTVSIRISYLTILFIAKRKPYPAHSIS